MTTVIVPIILLGMLIIFGTVFFLITSSQQKKNSINKKDKQKENSTKDNIPRKDMFDFMEFDRILDDMIVQENGSKFTMAVKCKGINYDLMSDVERLSVEEGFITLLNTLRFPIQLYVQAQNIDLKKNVRMYNERIYGMQEEYDEATEAHNNVLEHLDSTNEEIAKSELNKKSIQNVLEYANDIVRYVERLSINKSLLQRNFYIIYSYNSSEITSGDKFTKEEIIDICYNELYTRASGIISALSACSVNASLLNSNQLAELLYTSYDRDDSNVINIRQALESGYYRLYSTSNDAFQKRQEMLDKSIRQEAEIKAYEALKKAIVNGKFVPQEVKENQIDEEISKKAIDFIKEQKVNNSIKEKAKDIIVNEYKENKTDRMGKLKEKINETTDSLSNETASKNELSKELNKLEKNDIISDIEEDKKSRKLKKVESEEMVEKENLNIGARNEFSKADSSSNKVNENKEYIIEENKEIEFQESGLRNAIRESDDEEIKKKSMGFRNPEINDKKNKKTDSSSNADEDELII